MDTAPPTTPTPSARKHFAMIRTIIQAPNALLSTVAREVVMADFGSGLVERVALDLAETLRSDRNGLALAAPQIGYSVRMIAVRHGELIEVMLNPVICQRKKPLWMAERCLSVARGKKAVRRWRARRIRVEYQSEFGHDIKRGASDTEAQVFQHEIDHLDGITLLDPQPGVKS